MNAVGKPYEVIGEITEEDRTDYSGRQVIKSDNRKRKAFAYKEAKYNMEIRKYTEKDIPAMIRIWNKVVEDGVAFPQEDCLDETSGKDFFAAQSYCGVADDDGTIVGLYILHPNYAGRLGSISNASYAVDYDCRGKHIGEKLVSDCLMKAKELGFKILQFNAVVENNIHARHLYERLGFIHLGTIPQAFRMKDGSFESICIYYHKL